MKNWLIKKLGGIPKSELPLYQRDIDKLQTRITQLERWIENIPSELDCIKISSRTKKAIINRLRSTLK